MSRTFVITDIHGCCDEFHNLLQHLQLRYEDVLYIIGDIVDRGADSKRVITTIMDLQRSGFTVFPMRGNHEQLLLDSIDSGSDEDLMMWLENGGEETLLSYGVPSPDEIPMEHINFMRNLPYYILTDKFIFVHGSLNMKLDDPLSDSGKEEMLWGRKRITSTKKIGNRTVISGHTIKNMDDIRKSLSTCHIQIDNGCFLKGKAGVGNLVCLQLDNMELFLS